MIISVFDRVENTVGKGEIACTSNFSFSHNVFKRFLFLDGSKGVIVWEWVKKLNIFLFCPKQKLIIILVQTTLGYHDYNVTMVTDLTFFLY